MMFDKTKIALITSIALLMGCTTTANRHATSGLPNEKVCNKAISAILEVPPAEPDIARYRVLAETVDDCLTKLTLVRGKRQVANDALGRARIVLQAGPNIGGVLTTEPFVPPDIQSDRLRIRLQNYRRQVSDLQDEIDGLKELVVELDRRQQQINLLQRTIRELKARQEAVDEFIKRQPYGNESTFFRSNRGAVVGHRDGI